MSAVNESFEKTPDDHSPKGPCAWKRLLIAVTTKSQGDRLVERLCNQRVDQSHIRFYHADINDESVDEIPVANKDDLLDTTKAWRDVRFIIATATLTVAFNPQLAFYTVWLFVSNAVLPTYLSSEANKIMQLVARIPRGKVEEQRTQLVDHRLYLLFDCDYPKLQDLPKQVEGSFVFSRKRKLDDSDKKKRYEQQRGMEARLDLHGEGGAGSHHPVGDNYQALKATTAEYRANHLGSQVVYRYFEIAAKSGFSFQEMPTPSDEEQVRWKERDSDRGDGGNWRISAFNDRADALIAASLHTCPLDHFQILLEYHSYVARRLLLADGFSEQEALQTQRYEFLYGHCHGLTNRPDGSQMDALEKMLLGIFWTLCIAKQQPTDNTASIAESTTRFDFYPIAEGIKPAALSRLANASACHDQPAAAAKKLKRLLEAPDLDSKDVFAILIALDDLHDRPVGSTYADLSRRRLSIERLARFKVLTLREHEAAENRRLEQSGRHCSTVQLDPLLRKAWESHSDSSSGSKRKVLGLADLLMDSTDKDNLPQLLTHGSMHVASVSLREAERCARGSRCDREQDTVVVAPWIGALLTDATDAEVLVDKIKTLVRSMDGPGLDFGLNTSQWAQLKIYKVLERAFQLVSLKPVFKLGRAMIPGTKTRALESMTICEDGISSDIHDLCGKTLSDLCFIYCPEVKRHVRAEEYRGYVEQHELAEQLWCADQGLSPKSSPPSTREASRSHSPVRLDTMLIDTSTRSECYDQNRTRALLESLESCSEKRQEALQIVNLRLEKAQRDKEPTLTFELQRHILLRANDMQAAAMTIVTIRDTDERGFAMQEVAYDQPNGLGRQYARPSDSSCIISSSLSDTDPAEAALHRLQTGKTSRPKRRAVCYQGMHHDMRAICGGAFLHDVDLVKCFPSIIYNEARRRNILEKMPSIVKFKNDPETFISNVVQFHRLNANQNQDAKSEAKALLNSLICGASYRKWLTQRQAITLTLNPGPNPKHVPTPMPLP